MEEAMFKLEQEEGNLTLTLTAVASDWRFEDGEAGAD
jgi:hypothetical protein